MGAAPISSTFQNRIPPFGFISRRDAKNAPSSRGASRRRAPWKFRGRDARHVATSRVTANRYDFSGVVHGAVDAGASRGKRSLALLPGGELARSGKA